jgi:DNA-binding NarL/FixJ family response regulator
VPISVLIVDDDPVFRGLAARMLAGMGLQVVGEAGTVAAGVAAAADLRPDAALVDIGLPDGDGFLLAHRLAALEHRPRVVLTSSNPDAAGPGEAQGSGAVCFLSKADLPNDLLPHLLEP